MSGAALDPKEVRRARLKEIQTSEEDEKSWQEEEDRECLNNHDASEYRALAARANYLGLNRPDIQYAVKEICRRMSNSTRGDFRRLRRLGRYLVGRPRSVWCFEFQDACGELTGHTDADWAGCRKTARSTSGGAILEEAKLVAMVKISCDGDWP